MSDDPEHHRVEHLLAKLGEGRATAAETTELQLYADANPDLGKRIEATKREQQLGEGWLERLEGDRKVLQAESTKAVKIERWLGVGLLGGGYALTLLTAIGGTTVVVAGAVLLLYSFIRVRLRVHKTDPYKDVIR